MYTPIVVDNQRILRNQFVQSGQSTYVIKEIWPDFILLEDGANYLKLSTKELHRLKPDGSYGWVLEGEKQKEIV